MPKKNKKIHSTENYRRKKYKKKTLSSYNNNNFPKSLKLLIFFILIGIFISINTLKEKENFQNKIHIALNIDNKYIYPCIVFLTSLLDNRANSTFYIIHILTNNSMTIDSKNKINSIAEKFGNNSAKIIFHNLFDDFKGSRVGQFPIAVYYRIALPSLLSDVDKVIHIDVDIINFKDLSEMYNIKFKGNSYICASLDYLHLTKELTDLGINADKYINSGVLLMNLKEMRKQSIEKKIREFIKTHFLNLFDQTAINAVCRNNIQIMPFKYVHFAFDSFEKLVELNNEQKPQYRVTESELKQAYDDPTLLHYFAYYKPWNIYYSGYRGVYWWYYAKMSGFYQEILAHYHFSIHNIENRLKQIPEDGGFLKQNYKKFN